MAGSNSPRAVSSDSIQLQLLFTCPTTPSALSESSGTEDMTDDQRTLGNDHHDRNYHDDQDHDSLHSLPKQTGILIQEVIGSPKFQASGTATYNGQELPNWDDMGITLNTLVATLATIFRAMIAFIIFEILAQLKWNWVSDRFRPMQDIQRFDDASRGRLRPIAVALVSLGIGPFVQQSVQTYQCLRKPPWGEGSASVVIANTIDPYILEERTHNTFFEASVRLSTAMQDAIVNPTLDSNIGSLFSCQSGNCTFPTFPDSPKQHEDQRASHSSVGVCSRCIDVYELVEGPTLRSKGETMAEVVLFRLRVSEASKLYEEDEIQGDSIMAISLGNHFVGNNMNIRPVGNLTWARSAASDDFLNRARWSLGNFTILAPSQDHCKILENGTTRQARFGGTPFLPTDYVAATCILYPCIKHYSGKVENGRFSERVVRDVPLRVQRPEPLWTSTTQDAKFYEWKGVQHPCWVNETLYTSSNMSKAGLGPNSTAVVQFHTSDWPSESIDGQAGYTNITAPLECISEIPETLLRVIRNKMRDFNTSCSVYQRGSKFACHVDHLAGFLRNTSTSVDTIRENVDSLAMRITTEIRKSGRGAWSEDNAKVEGDVWENRTCVYISWKWLTLPATLLAFCAVLLIWTVVKDALSKSGVIWKASVLPFLLKDQPGLERMGLKGVEEVAKGLEVKMQH
ncbi:hypothetical protein ACJZ2D_008667 [Fusarium nematophilum]